MKKTALLAALLLCLTLQTAYGEEELPMTLTLIRETPAPVACYDKYEALLNAPPLVGNPYDPDELSCVVNWLSPTGEALMTDAFWYVGYDRTLRSGVERLIPNGLAGWMLRFTPRVEGQWSYAVTLTEQKSGRSYRFPADGMHSVNVAKGSRKGFLQVDAADPSYLCFDDGSPYLGIGHNLCGWEWGGTDNLSGTYEYDRWLNRLHDAMGTMAQFDFGEGDQLEWTPLAGELPFSEAWEGLGRYNQQTAWKMDHRFQTAEELGIYFRLSMFHWEDFDNETENFPDWGWNRNPYNRDNGGMCDTVTDFFEDTAAREQVKRFLRYAVARWGYSANLLAWELWNEVDAPDMIWGAGKRFEDARTQIVSWHEDMGAYLRCMDPNAHLVTTSYANTYNDPDMWALDAMDMTTFHRYTYFNPEYQDTRYDTVPTLARLIRERFEQTHKPVLVGEFALSPGGDIQKDFDPTGAAFHQQLWASVMAKGLGTAMHWTWGSYIDEYDLYHHYTPLAKFFADADLRGLTAQNTLDEDTRVQHMALLGPNTAYLWLIDRDYHFANLDAPLERMVETQLTLPLVDGEYTVTWMDPYNGCTLICEEARTIDGRLTLRTPSFERDIAVRVEPRAQALHFMLVDLPAQRPSSRLTQFGKRLTLHASGTFGGMIDQCSFSHLELTGDFSLTARLERFSYLGEKIKAGLMARTGLSADACFAAVYLTPTGQAGFGVREKGVALMPLTARAMDSTRLMLKREGNTLSGFLQQADTWLSLGSVTISDLPATLWVGMVASSQNPITYSTAVFTDIHLIR